MRNGMTDHYNRLQYGYRDGILSSTGSSVFGDALRVAQPLARLYLQDPSLGLSETASLLGYEDLNSFLRAFRVWVPRFP
jgi:AraC-like DNA-binding protein